MRHVAVCTLLLASILLSATWAHGQTFTVLHTFSGPDGSFPTAGLFRDSAGNLYGTTFWGGALGLGTVYKIDANNNETVLYSFAGGTDGANPYGSVIRDSAGNLYGTTSTGGSPVCQCGTVFKVNSAGKETVLYRFRGGTDGASPMAGLLRDSAGNLYGTTSAGGTNNSGTVFKINSSNKESVLYRFTGGVDGSQPLAGLIRDTAGNFYGTTYGGGNGGGVVFKLDVNNIETALNDFSTLNADAPAGGVIFCGGGANVCGTLSLGFVPIYQVGRKTGTLTPIGSTNGYGDGMTSMSGLVQDKAGDFYGTMSCCAQSDAGTLFEVTTKGEYKLPHIFDGYSEGGYPQGDLVLDKQGNIYGTNNSFGNNDCQCGTVWKFTP